MIGSRTSDEPPRVLKYRWDAVCEGIDAVSRA